MSSHDFTEETVASNNDNQDNPINRSLVTRTVRNFCTHKCQVCLREFNRLEHLNRRKTTQMYLEFLREDNRNRRMLTIQHEGYILIWSTTNLTWFFVAIAQLMDAQNRSPATFIFQFCQSKRNAEKMLVPSNPARIKVIQQTLKRKIFQFCVLHIHAKQKPKY